ncbi:DUF3846 domain-containing protein [Tessaracoccus sp.]
MKNSEIVVLHLPVDGVGASLKRIPATMEAMQALVGGDLEGVTIHPWAYAYINEVGRLVAGARPNRVLNALVRELQPTVMVGESLFGDAFVCSDVDAQGYDQDVNPGVVALVKCMGVQITGLGLDKKYDNC